MLPDHKLLEAFQPYDKLSWLINEFVEDYLQGVKTARVIAQAMNKYFEARLALLQ